MKRILSISLLLALAIIGTGCGGKKTPTPITYKDGSYYAEADDYDENGFKGNVSIVVDSGVIAYVNWDATDKETGESKKALSKDGTYGMVAKGGAQAEWHIQAERMETYLLGAQDPKTINLISDGKTDTVTGVSISVSPFVELCEKALADAR